MDRREFNKLAGLTAISVLAGSRELAAQQLASGDFPDWESAWKSSPDDIQFQIPHQLLSVLPPRSKMLVPVEYRPLMEEDDSAIRDYFPLRFIIDRDGAYAEHAGVVVLPNIDPQRVLDAVATIPLKGKKKDLFFGQGKVLLIERKPELIQAVKAGEAIRERVAKTRALRAKRGPGGPTGDPRDAWKKLSLM